MLQEAGNCTLITWRAKLKCGPITTGEITDIRLLDELYVNKKFCVYIFLKCGSCEI